MNKSTLLPLSLAVMAALSAPTVVADDDMGFTFSGYARYGAAYQGGDSKYIKPEGSLNGNSTGRLGNEVNGGEFQFSKPFAGTNGTKFDVTFMLNHWESGAWNNDGGGVGIAKAYAGASNIFESQPDLYVWAGRDFHTRPQTGLNDYFWMMHDGQGGGFRNLDLGGAKFDLAFVGQLESARLTNDNGKYAITSKMHGINLGEASLSIYANYGFASEEQDALKDVKAAQAAAEIGYKGQRFIVRYSNNAKDAVYDLNDGQTALLASFDGSTSLSDNMSIEYLTAYQKLENKDSSDDRANYNVIVRPAYSWNDIHSTWIEAGYDVVDYANKDQKNSAWKVTFSQNIAVGAETWSRPMLRFYATVGEAKQDGVTDAKVDAMTVGAMWEAWW
ncbi:carbohydrate porin [Vibrio sp. SCSIO 43136]|uniref:carbohydrate porin n=1 Tax=Vibrio sp. SCSIO 43136 TaxID=2819101 RepID=UPI0020750F87|nr:carbohydrate porin [Vibrio sp. SCSIO 43136]USD65834.1 carbohydrate porin [Vibrio sp. SCSIO 43136]